MKHLLAIAVCASLLGAGVAESREIEIKQQFSGAGTETAVDTNTDYNYAFAFTTEHRGASGRSTGIGLSEFLDFKIGDCPNNDMLTSDLVQHSIVQTFTDLSTLHMVATYGRICYDTSSGEITCDEKGNVVGGTGRFEGATGLWTLECEIFALEGVNAVTGKVKATISIPRGRGHHH